MEIFDLANEEGNRYADMIYDETHLQVTRQVIGNVKEKNVKQIEEEEVLELSQQYFQELSKYKDTGQVHLQKYIRWQNDLSVRELLRGKERFRYTFLVLEQDPELRDEMDKAEAIKDRWKRREAWRKLSSRIAQISIQVDARPEFQPRSIADEYGARDLWFLRPIYYSSRCGLNIKGEPLIY